MSQEKSKRTLEIIAISVTIVFGILGFAGLLIVNPNNLLMTPAFEIKLSTEDSLEKAYVVNNGMTQAKNVKISLNGNDDLVIKKSDCPESFEVLPSDNSKKLNLHLERMSLKIGCSIFIASQSSVISIVVTADDSPASVKEYSKNTERFSNIIETLIPLFYAIPIITIVLLVVYLGFMVYRFFRS